MAQSKHVTLVGALVMTVELGVNAARIEVFHRGNVADDVWFTTNGATPVAEADGVYLVTAGSAVEVPDETGGQNSVVKLLSAGAVKVSVRAL